MEGLGESNRKLAIFAYQQLPPSSLGGLLGCWVPQGRPGWMLRGENKAGAGLQWELGVSVCLSHFGIGMGLCICLSELYLCIICMTDCDIPIYSGSLCSFLWKNRVLICSCASFPSAAPLQWGSICSTGFLEIRLCVESGREVPRMKRVKIRQQTWCHTWAGFFLGLCRGTGQGAHCPGQQRGTHWLAAWPQAAGSDCCV